MWNALAAFFIAAALVWVTRDGLKYLRERDAKVDDDVAPPKTEPRKKVAAEDLNDERMIDLLREGPRAHDKRALEMWKAEQRAQGLDDNDIEVMLDNREPILSI